MGPYIIVSLTLSMLLYQERGKDTCLNYEALRATAILTIRRAFVSYFGRPFLKEVLQLDGQNKHKR